VRLFFDEDRGKGVAIALNAVGVPTHYVGPKMPVHKQTPDVIWIPRAGDNRWLVISANKAILTTPHERELWIKHRVGGVFLASNQLRSIDELRLLLRKLEWLELIDRDEQRPFAFILGKDGKARHAPEIPLIGSSGQAELFRT
jgi:hypothetical protein